MFRAFVVVAVLFFVALSFSSFARAGDAPKKSSVKNPATVALAKYRRALADAKAAHTTRLANSEKQRILFWQVVRPVDVVASPAVARR